MAFQRRLDDIAQEKKEREERARHKYHIANWGFDYTDSDGDLRSETASERNYRLVNEEADVYMNSPGPGSD
jgi:hypothetical protein